MARDNPAFLNRLHFFQCKALRSVPGHFIQRLCLGDAEDHQVKVDAHGAVARDNPAFLKRLHFFQCKALRSVPGTSFSAFAWMAQKITMSK